MKPRPIDTLTPDAIRSEIQRLQAQLERLEQAHAADALAALEGHVSAIDARTNLADQIAEIRSQIHAFKQALPHAVARERREQQRERDALVTTLSRKFCERCAERDNRLRALVGSILPTAHDLSVLADLHTETERLRQALLAATAGDRAFAKPFDTRDQLRFAWVEQARARQKLVDFQWPKADTDKEVAWRSDADRLLHLTAALAAAGKEFR